MRHVPTIYLHALWHFINTDPILVPAPEPSVQPETFKKKDVIEILSHKKAYNACKYNMVHDYVSPYLHLILYPLVVAYRLFCFQISKYLWI